MKARQIEVVSKIRSAFSARALIAFAALFLAGCVSGGPVPPQDLASIFSPSQIAGNDVGNPAQKELEAASLDSAGTATGFSEEPQNATNKATEAANAVSSSVPQQEPAADKTKAAEISQLSEPAASATKEVASNAPSVKSSTEAKTASVGQSREQAAIVVKDAATASIPKQPKPVAQPKPKGFFASLFQGNSAAKPPQAVGPNKRNIVKKTSKRPRRGLAGNLPGVRSNVFGVDDNAAGAPEEAIQLASVTNQARRGNFGLLLQTKNVRVSCFPPKLVRILKMVERRYRRTPIVTSGFRSRRKNRSIRGARNSTHIRCMAADIQVTGISKWQLAKYLRSIPGRGGVGTYCHTKSVHIDIGTKRDWNWRCRRKKRRR